MKIYFLNVLIYLGCSVICAQELPNVIVVLADDIGVGDISFYRRQHTENIIVETPAIDKLANNGVIFTDAHSPAALCAPSRYAIMTGNHCYRSDFPWGVWGAYQKSPIKPNQLTLGKLMRNAGYQTGFFGKWHLGGDYYVKGDSTKIYRGPRHKPELNVDIRQIVSGGPQSNGFDYSFTFPAGIQASPYAVFEDGKMLPLDQDSQITFVTQEKMNKIGVKLDKLEGLGDSNWDPHNMGPLLVSKALDFIKNREKGKPFFMYYSTQAVHLPHTPPKKLDRTPIANTTPSKHLDMVKELDVQMRLLVNTLKKEGVYKNTMIIFTSDNGGLLRRNTLASGHKSSDIYRGGKNQSYEGGHRVPFIVSWPNSIKSRVLNHPVLGLDIMATLADLTHQKIDEDQAMDSSTLLPLVLETSSKMPHQYLMTQGGTGKEVMITKDGWKLIMKVDKKDITNRSISPFALFNLNDNVSENESYNLIDNPDYAKKIKQLYQLYKTTRESRKATAIR